MARGDEDPDPPCDHYEMTEPFRAWVVGRMQKEVAAEIPLGAFFLREEE